VVVSMSRRALIGGTIAALGAAGTGVAAIVSVDDEALIRATLHRLIGRFDISDKDMASFVRDFCSSDWNLGRWKPYVLRAGALTGMTTAIAEPVMSDDLERFERKLLTAFVMSTDYLQAGHKMGSPLQYCGLAEACVSPFAEFSLEA
jgi:hypothetical protein